MNDKELKEYDFNGESSLDREYLILIKEQKTKILNFLLNKMLHGIEANDKDEIIFCIKKYIYLNKYHNIPIEDIHLIIIGLDKSIRNNYTDLPFVEITEKFLSKLFHIFKREIKIKIDWKIYFKLYDILLTFARTSAINITTEKDDAFFDTNVKFCFRALKFFHITKDDYNYIKKIIYIYFYSIQVNQIVVGIDICKMFMNVDYLSEDKEFQEVLFNLLKEKSEYSNSILSIFRKIMKKKELLIDKEIFINSFFDLLINYFSISPDKIGNNSIKKKFVSKSDDTNNKINKDNSKSSYTISYSMCWIFVKIYTDDSFKNYDKLIKKHTEGFINFMNLNLGESSEKELSSAIVSVLFDMLDAAQKILFKKKITYLNKIMTQKNFIPIKENKEKVISLINVLLPLITKCLFYYEEDGSLIMEALTEIAYSYEINDKIMEIFWELFNNMENEVNVFLSKIGSFIKVFMNITNLSIKNSSSTKLLNQIIIIIPDLITSANEEQNIDILFVMNSIFGLINEKKDDELYKNNEGFNLIMKNAFNVSVEIVIRMLRLFDFISGNQIQYFFFDFVFLCSKINTEENKKKIQNLVLNYPNDNYIPEENVNVYFLLIYYLQMDLRLKYETLWKNAMKTFLTKDINENLFEKQSHNLIDYDLKQISFQIEEHNKKKLKYYKSMFSCFEFETFFPYNEELKTQLIQIIILCLNNNDIHYRRVGFTLSSRIINGILCRRYLKDEGIKFSLPKKDDIEFSCSFFKLFIEPYVKFFEDLIENFNNNLTNLEDENNKLIQDKVDDWFIDNYFGEDEVIDKLTILLKLGKIFTSQIDNPFMINIYNEDYKEIYIIREKILNLVCDLCPFLQKTKLIKNQKILKYYLTIIMYDTIDPSKNALSRYSSCIKKLKLYYEHLFNAELGLYDLLEHQFFYYAMLRYFKVDLKINYSDKRVFNKELIIRKFKILLYCFLYSIELSMKTDLILSTTGFYLALTKEDWINLFNEFNKILTDKVIKITSKEIISYNGNHKILNIIFFYSNLMNFTFVTNIEYYSEVLKHYSHMITYLKEDVQSTLAIGILNSKLLKRKNIFKLSARPLKNRINAVFSYDCIPIDIEYNTNLYNDYLSLNNIKNDYKLIEERDHKIKLSIFKTFNDLFDKIKSEDCKSLNEKMTLQIIITYFNLMMNLCDLNIQEDYDILNTFENMIYNFYIKNDINSLNIRRLCYCFITLTTKLKYLNTFTTKIIKLDETNKKYNTLEEYLINYKSDKVIISNNIPLYIIEKKKNNNNIQNSNKIRFETEEDVQKFIISLLNTKDLISNQQMIKISNQDIVTSSMTSINKYSEYKMLYQFFSVNSNKNVVNLDTVYNIFQKIFQDKESFDESVCFSIYTQIFGGLIKIYIIEYRENPTSALEEIIKKYLNIFMSLYTNNKNKFKDDSLTKLFVFLISSTNVKTFRTLFTNDKGEFIYFNYGNDFSVCILDAVISLFNEVRLPYIFNNPIEHLLLNENNNINITKQFSIIENYLNDQNLFLTKETFIIAYSYFLLVACNNINQNVTKFNIDYDKEKIEKFVKYLMQKYDENQLSIKKLIVVFVCTLDKLFILNPEFLIEIFIFVSNIFIESDFNHPSEHTISLINMESNFLINTSNELIKSYLRIINEHFLKSNLTIVVKQYLLDFLINILKANLNQIIEKTEEREEIFFLVFSLISNCGTDELREYITNNLLIFFINSCSINEIKKISESTKNFLINSKYENEYEKRLSEIFPIEKKYYALFILGSITKGFYLNIPEYIQNIILFFTHLYKNVYKQVGIGSKIIKKIMNEFLSKYEYSNNYVKKNLSDECSDAIRDLTDTNLYFS